MAHIPKTFKIPKFMKGLSEERRTYIDNHLILDKNMSELVLTIQDEWGQCSDIKPDSLLTAIIRYKQNQITPRLSKAAVRLGAPENVAKIAELQVKMENTLNPITAMEALVNKQLARLERMTATEAKMPTLMDVVTKNIGLLHGQLKDLAILQMQTGILRRVPKKDNQGLTKEEMEFVTGLKDAPLPREATLTALEFLAQNNLLGAEYEDALDEDEE